MEKLVQGDQDKTEQLERLRKENGQLSLSLTEQVEMKENIFLHSGENVCIVLSLFYTWMSQALGKISEKAICNEVSHGCSQKRIREDLFLSLHPACSLAGQALRPSACVRACLTVVPNLCLCRGSTRRSSSGQWRC